MCCDHVDENFAFWLVVAANSLDGKQYSGMAAAFSEPPHQHRMLTRVIKFACPVITEMDFRMYYE